MAKKVLTTIKLQAPGGQASPAPPVGPALGQHGINIMEFVKSFNAQTGGDMGTTIPVVITVYEDRSFTFVTKTPPAAVLIRQAIGIEKGSGEPNRTKVGTISKNQVRAIAEKAGADYVGADDLAKRIQDEGFTDFDVAIATPDMMPVVGRLGRILGSQGKMPNPKVGTVTMDVRKAVEESKAGKVEYRTDRTAIVHMTLGKTSFPDEQLVENFQAVIEELNRAKPSAAKGKYLRSVIMASTQGPGIKIDPSRTRDLVEAEGV